MTSAIEEAEEREIVPGRGSGALLDAISEGELFLMADGPFDFAGRFISSGNCGESNGPLVLYRCFRTCSASLIHE
jgi:hypothetical protein